MKKLLSVFLVSTGVLTIVNVIVYRNYSDYNTFDYGPLFSTQASNRDDLLIVTYADARNNEMVLQRYFWGEEYKYIYYQPIEMAKDFVLIKNNWEIAGQKVFSYSADSLIYIGDWHDLLNLNHIPDSLLITGGSDTEVYRVKTIHCFPSDIKISLFDKWTLGPIMEVFQ